MQFNQSRFGTPPRQVPLSLAIVNTLSGFAQVGWFVFGFGMIFFWIFVMSADLSFLTFRGVTKSSLATLTRSEETNTSVGGERIMAHHYELSVGGQSFRGVSYSTAVNPGVGGKVRVEYLERNPEQSRIEGMRRSMFGPGVIFVAIFPAIGALLAYFAMKSGARRNHLLRDGIVTSATLKEKRGTNMYVNKRRVFELVFEFTSRDGRKHEIKESGSRTELLEDEASEPILYDPADPSRALLLDEGSSRPELNEQGELRGRPIAAIRSLIVPLAVLAANAIPLLRRFGIDVWALAVGLL